MITANRYHDISAGHRVVKHESKCKHFHGHNYRIHFKIATDELDEVGRVIDFSVIKSFLCQWLEENWDHKMLLWKEDPYLPVIRTLDPDGIVELPFNPTAENMASYLVTVVAPMLLPERVRLVECIVEETRKCSVTYSSYGK